MSPPPNSSSKSTTSCIRIRTYPSRTRDSNMSWPGWRTSTAQGSANWKCSWIRRRKVSKTPPCSTTLSSRNSRRKGRTTSSSWLSSSSARSKVWSRRTKPSKWRGRYLLSDPGFSHGKQETQRHHHQQQVDLRGGDQRHQEQGQRRGGQEDTATHQDLRAEDEDDRGQQGNSAQEKPGTAASAAGQREAVELVWGGKGRRGGQTTAGLRWPGPAEQPPQLPAFQDQARTRGEGTDHRTIHFRQRRWTAGSQAAVVAEEAGEFPTDFGCARNEGQLEGGGGRLGAS